MKLYQKIRNISKTIKIGIVTGLAALVLGCGEPSNYSSIPNDPILTKTSKILFTSNKDGNYNLYKINPDGSGLEQITNTPWDEYSSDWSPDGTKIVYQSSEGSDPDNQIYLNNLFIINKDGTNKIKLTFEGTYNGIPRWSPSGTKIVFISNRDGNAEIYTMNSDGTNQNRLTNNSGYDSSPTWSPDEKYIAFSSDIDDINREIYLINVNSLNIQRLTNNNYYDDSPKWSPDGSKIAFISNRESDDNDIYIMDINGENIKRLTYSTRADDPSSVGNWAPDWSTDGENIVFTSDRDKVDTGQFSEIYIMKSDGSKQKRITFNKLNWAPSWSPYLE